MLPVLLSAGASFVKELSLIDDGLWGFEVPNAYGYVLGFFRSAIIGGSVEHHMMPTSCAKSCCRRCA